MVIIKRLTLTRISFACSLVVLTLVICPAVFWITSGETAPRIVHGDFPAFYTGATIASEKSCSAFYDLSEQGSIQQRYFPERVDYFHPFAYPVPLGVVLSPLALFSPNAAYAIHLVIMFGFLWASVYLLNHVKGDRSESRIITLAYVMLFVPSYVGWVNGQIAAFIFFCFSLFAMSGLTLLSSTNGKKSWLAKLGLGVAVGGLILKPQFALLPAFYCLFAGQWLSLGIVALIGVGWYLLGAWSCGLLWPINWLSFASHFNSIDQGLNGQYMISLPGASAQILSLAGIAVPSSFFIGMFLVSLIVVLVWATRWPYYDRASRVQLVLRIPLLAVLLSPHSLGYDSLAFLFPGLFLDRSLKGVLFLVAVQVSVVFAELVSEKFLVNPLAVLGCVMFFIYRGQDSVLVGANTGLADNSDSV